MPRRTIVASVVLVVIAGAGLLTVGRATAATAGSDGDVVLGVNDQPTTTTTGVTTTGLTGLKGQSSDASGTGVYGSGGFTGLYGSGGYTGVQGNGGTYGLYATGGTYGVYASGGPYGVFAQGDTAAVYAYSSTTNNTGVGLEVVGRSVFRSAGTAVIASAMKKVTVALAGVTASDFVLATVQGAGAFYVKNAFTGTDQFTITISKAPTAPATVTVAYFVISAS